MRVHLLAALLLGLVATLPAPGLAAQSAGDPAPDAPAAPPSEPGQDTGHGILASVNGEPITTSDVAFHAWMRAGAALKDLDPTTFIELRNQLAEQVLMATEAQRLGVTISEAYIAEFWETYHEAEPDYAALAQAAGTTEDRARELVRRSVLADLYLYHVVGIWAEFGHQIRPDPLLAHAVEVIPRELRDLFQRERQFFDRPATVTYDYYACPDEATAAGVAEALGAGLVPTQVRPAQETAPLDVVPQVFSFSPALVTYLQSAAPGTVSQVFDADVGWVVFVVQSRAEARPAEFAEVQEELRRRMRLARLEQARQQLVADLERVAVYLPQDLFGPPPGGGTGSDEAPSAGAQGGASTLRKP